MSDYENGIEEAKSETLKSPARISKGPAPSDTITSEDSLEHKVSLRMEIMLKKEKLRLEEEANYTYKPKLYTSQKNKPQTPTPAAEPVAAEDGTGRENRFDKLYSDALKRHITQNLKEDQKDKDLTFTPKITKRASSASRSGSNSRSSSRERGGPSDGASDGRQTPRSRKSLEPEKPSFQPVITKRAKSIERARDKEVSDRLYENGLHVKEKMERKRVEAEQKELETCTFAPKVDTRRASSASRLNVVDRMSRFEEVRQRKLQNALEQKKETERSYSFQPTLMSKRPATPTQQPFYERLATPHEKPVSHAAMEALSNLTFQPQIVSKRTPSPNTTRHSLGDYKTVHERLYREGEERRREVENELQSKRHELDSELTFHPQIITPTPQHPDPVFERLSVGADRNEVKQKLDRIKAELTKDWTFQPQISEVSKKLLGPRRETDVSLYERQVAEQRRLEEDNIRKKQDKEREQLKEATFAPKLPESSKELAKKKLSTSNMDLNATGGLDVYSRLASAQSPTGTLQENSASSLNNVTTHNPIQPNINSRSIILPEKVLSQVFERLATPSVQQFEEYTRDAEGKKIVLPEKEKEQVFNRLVEKKTTSFTLKTQGIESRITSHPNSATSKNAFSEEAFLQKIEEERNQPPPASPGKTLAHKDSHLSAVSSITAGTATKETPVKKTRSASASKATSATTTPARQTTRPAATSTAKKSAVKPGAANLPSPPVVRREKISNASPMPPAPPATAVKANQATTQADYYDDLSKKLEASLSLINQTNGVAPPPAPATAEKNHKNSKATTTPNAKKYAITDSPLPKDQEDYINSIPLVADPTNGELSD